jgi:hypothetical protein
MDITNEERHGRRTFSPAIPQLQGARRNRLRSRSRKFQLLSTSKFLPPQESATANFARRTILPYTLSQRKRLSKKYRSLSKKCKLIIQILNANCRSVLNAHLYQETSVRRNTRWAGRPTARNMKRCALCHGKLGLGVRFRNIWNGTWWVHVRFCSVRCGAIYQDTQNNAATHTAGTPSLLTALRGAECL